MLFISTQEWMQRDRILFLLRTADSSKSDWIYEWAISNAYLDFCRVLSGYAKSVGEMDDEETPKAKTKGFLRNEFKKFFDAEAKRKEEFNDWHVKTINGVCSIWKETVYKNNLNHEREFTIGCAQKWVNMTFKYLYALLDSAQFLGFKEIENSKFKFCHIPLDRYVIENAAMLGVNPSFHTPWSQIDNYGDYKGYEEKLFDLAQKLDITPLEFESFLWIKSNEASDKLRKEEQERTMKEKIWQFCKGTGKAIPEGWN